MITRFRSLPKPTRRKCAWETDRGMSKSGDDAASSYEAMCFGSTQ
jgi:hypothetical protein